MPRRRILDPDEEDEDYKGAGAGDASSKQPAGGGGDPYRGAAGDGYADPDSLAQAEAAGVDTTG